MHTLEAEAPRRTAVAEADAAAAEAAAPVVTTARPPLGERSPAALHSPAPAPAPALALRVMRVWFREGLKVSRLGVDAYIVQVVEEKMRAWSV